MLELCELGTIEECKGKVREAVTSGKAIEKLAELIEKQGGNKAVINDYSLFPQAAHKFSFVSQKCGYIESMKTDTIGIASLELGAGRETKNSSIDYAAGILFNKKTGDKVEKGEVIAVLYTNKKDKLGQACKLLDSAICFCEVKPEVKPLILAYIDVSGSVEK